MFFEFYRVYSNMQSSSYCLGYKTSPLGTPIPAEYQDTKGAICRTLFPGVAIAYQQTSSGFAVIYKPTLSRTFVDVY